MNNIAINKIFLGSGLLTATGNQLYLNGNLVAAGGSVNLQNLITGAGTVGTIPLFTATSGITNSNISQLNGSIGIKYPNPEFQLDISGQTNIRLNNNITVLSASGVIDNYFQINVLNDSSGKFASSDLVCTNDIGTESTYYFNAGINGSQYTGQYIGWTGDTYAYGAGNDMYIGNVTPGKNLYLFAGNVPFTGNSTAVTLSYNGNIGINTPNPLYHLDVRGSGFLSSGVTVPFINVSKTITPTVNIASPSAQYSTVYVENLAQRGILAYANNLGIGKNIQNTFALENIHNFSPNTTTTMNVIGTAATSAGTLSHPVTFADITGAGFTTNFAIAASTVGPAGMQSATTPFYLTSGTTGIGAGFFFATQFQFPDLSGVYPTGSGLNTGFNFFAGMTDAVSVVLSTTSAWNTASTLGFQFIRQTGISGRNDNTIKFVSKANGAAAAFYIQETNCPFVTKENYAAYVYARNDFRNGVHWAIKRIDPGIVYTGDFTGGYNTLPLVSSSVQTFLKPSIGMNFVGSGAAARNLKLKGLYCETV